MQFNHTKIFLFSLSEVIHFQMYNAFQLFMTKWYVVVVPVMPLAYRAVTKDLHSFPSLVIFSTVPQVFFHFIISASTVLRHVFLGLPLFLFPSGVQCRATLVMESWSFLMTWPIHFHLRLNSMVVMPSMLHCFNRSSLDIFLGQNIPRIYLRFLVWKVDSFVRSISVILQHSDPYSNVDRTQLWYNLRFVCLLYCCDFHMLFIVLKMFLALLIRLWMSSLAPPSLHTCTMLPRYVNFSAFAISFPSIFTVVVWLVLRHISSVLRWLMFKPICLAQVLRRFVLSCICWCV